MTETLEQRLRDDMDAEILAELGSRPNAAEYAIYRRKVSEGRYKGCTPETEVTRIEFEYVANVEVRGARTKGRREMNDQITDTQATPECAASRAGSANSTAGLGDLLAPKHTGMKISAHGVLGRIRDGRYYKELNFGCGEMLRHLEEMAARFYTGDAKSVDEFLQLYDLDEQRPETHNVKVSGEGPQARSPLD